LHPAEFLRKSHGSSGTSSTAVAVIDSGINYVHEDLAANRAAAAGSRRGLHSLSVVNPGDQGHPATRC